MISLNIATHKARRKFLKPCIESVLAGNTLPDVINVYFNDYKAPKWLKDFKVDGVTFEISEAGMGDLGASAKFVFCENQDEGVYITLDDDLIVSKGYIGYMADAAYRYPCCIVGLHGTNYNRFPVKSYYADDKQEVFYCYSGKSNTSIVDNLGTGCIAFRAAMDTKPRLIDFPEKNMTDPYLFKWAKKTHTPLVCLVRANGLVKEQADSQDSAIWKGLLKGDTLQTKVINSVSVEESKLMRKIPLASETIPTSQLGGASLEWGHIKAILSAWQNESGHLLVEFGSGKSSDIWARLGQMISFEHNSDYVHSHINRHRPIENGWYSLTQEDRKYIAEAKVAVIDGPLGQGGYRYNFPLDLLPKDCRVFVDDCHRPKDKAMAENIAKAMKRKATYIQGKEKIMAVI